MLLPPFGFELERESLALVQENKVRGTRQHSHLLQTGALYLVPGGVRDMEPYHVGLGPDPQMLDKGFMDFKLGTCWQWPSSDSGLRSRASLQPADPHNREREPFPLLEIGKSAG